MARPDLKNLDAYQVHLTESLGRGSPRQCAAFAASLAERWFPAYESFSTEEEWGDSAGLRRALDAAWGHVGGRELVPAEAQRLSGLIDDITPHMDDFDAEDALIACVAVQDALRACVDPANALSIAVHSALGIFEGLVSEWPVQAAAEQRVWKKSVVRNELRAQLALLEETACTNFDATTLPPFRERVAKQTVKPKPQSKPKGPPALTNQVLFEQYRRMVESDLKGQLRGQPDPETGTFLFAITYLGFWAGRYSRRLQTINGSYGRWADEPGRLALVARNRALDAAATGTLDWAPEVRDAITMCLENNSRLKVLDAKTVETPHASGPSMRRLWLEGGWQRIREWAAHRPACWESEDRRKKKGLAQSMPELTAMLADEVEWQPTGDPEYPWSAVNDSGSWRVRINDFPDDLLYSLLVGDRQIGHFHDWPETWNRGEIKNL